MKLVLCSESFHTQNTAKACVDLVGKPQNKITFAIINEAYAAEHGDKRWVISNLNDVAKNFPAEMDMVNLLAFPLKKIEERILQKDAIFVVGGHTDYLMSVFVRTGFNKLLPKLLKIAHSQEVREVKISEHGEKYVIDGQIKAPSGKVLGVRTIWIIETNQKSPRFITTYPV